MKGKTCAWQVLLKAMEKLDGVESVSYNIDPKAMSKDLLFGSLEQTTREWSDGLFTHIMRKIIDNVAKLLSLVELEHLFNPCFVAHKELSLAN